ncbi:hypothetical protein [Pseudomonas sp. NPDC089758]|uniref:hypothetical protein n=1 Tax=Pseudomonas sp. NPDC089758 TaxID=3364473 RepID=UPI00382AC2EF
MIDAPSEFAEPLALARGLQHTPIVLEYQHKKAHKPVKLEVKRRLTFQHKRIKWHRLALDGAWFAPFLPHRQQQIGRAEGFTTSLLSGRTEAQRWIGAALHGSLYLIDLQAA